MKAVCIPISDVRPLITKLVILSSLLEKYAGEHAKKGKGEKAASNKRWAKAGWDAIDGFYKKHPNLKPKGWKG